MKYIKQFQIIILYSLAGEILHKLLPFSFPAGFYGIRNSIAEGVAIGTASHAIGTSKAFELGETEGAISSLSIVIAGVITVLPAILFVGFY